MMPGDNDNKQMLDAHWLYAAWADRLLLSAIDPPPGRHFVSSDSHPILSPGSDQAALDRPERGSTEGRAELAVRYLYLADHIGSVTHDVEYLYLPTRGVFGLNGDEVGRAGEQFATGRPGNLEVWGK